MREALAQGQENIEAIWIARGKKSARIQEILKMAGDQKVPVHLKSNSEISCSLPDTVHQGVVAVTKAFAYATLAHIMAVSLQGSSRALIIAADHVTDEGNLGALIRTAAFFGAHGIIIPKDRSAGVSPRVLKRSSGAHVYVPIARVVNLGRALDLARDKGLWIIGASGESPHSIYQLDWDGDVVLVLGNEQRGLSRSIQRRCDQMVGIPPQGGVASLNVAVAGGVILSEIVRQRVVLQGPDRNQGLDKGA